MGDFFVATADNGLDPQYEAVGDSKVYLERLIIRFSRQPHFPVCANSTIMPITYYCHT
jgi:hypothetical protein